MQFPTTSRYDLIMNKVYEFFMDEGIYRFPVNPFKIIKENKWGIITYSELAAENNMTIEQIIKACQSEDAYILRDENNFTIAYNDTIESPLRIRFTLMHEIGHIKLNHLIDFEETILRRSTLTKTKYQILEREANAFARNVLFPPFLYEPLKRKFSNFLVNDSSELLLISPSAVRTRLQMLQWDLHHIKDYLPELLTKFQGYINYIIDSKQCLKCRHFIISRFASFCPICAFNKFSKRKGEKYMIYNGFQVDENGRAIECPRCKNEEIYADHEFCKICSVPIVNKCTNVTYDFDQLVWECGTILDGNARFCTKCGSKSTFAENDLLTPWEIELKEASNKRNLRLASEFN